MMVLIMLWIFIFLVMMVVIMDANHKDDVKAEGIGRINEFLLNCFQEQKDTIQTLFPTVVFLLIGLKS